MRIWIHSPLAVLLAEDQPCGGVVVDDDEIEAVLPPGETPDGPVDERVDAAGLVLLPGLVNTHHHYCQNLTRALRGARELFPWLKTLYPIWEGLTPEMIRASTQLAAAELMLSGCTTSTDHHYLFTESLTDAFDIQARAVAETGMRTVLTRGSMSLGEDHGGLPPRSTVQDEDDILADCERVIDRYHDPNPGALLQVALAPCSPFSVTPALMREAADLARARGVRLHTHLAETLDETRYCEDEFGMRPLDLLESVGWLAGDAWLAHGVHFNDDEIARLGAAGTGVSHCPSSNMTLSSGTCRALELERSGAPVGLAVDGSASNDGSNLMQECRQAFLLQRLRYGAAQVTHRDALRWATAGSARCLGRNDIGAIAPGMAADLALFALDEPRFSGSGDPLAALVHCGAHRAKHVMVAGRWVVRDGRLVNIDLDALMHEHQDLARQLVQS